MGEVALGLAAPAPGRRNCRVATWSVAWIRRRIGATSRFAKFRPNQIAESSTISAISANIEAKAIWTPWRRLSIARYSAARGARDRSGTRPRAGSPRGRRRGRRPRIAAASAPRRRRGRRAARRRSDRPSSAASSKVSFGQRRRILQHVDIGAGHDLVRRLDDPRDRQAERGRPRGHELVEPAPVDVEDRPRSREVVGEDADLARRGSGTAPVA